MTRYRSTTESACRWAVFYLVGSVLATLRPLIVDSGLRISLALVVYLTGLLTQQNVTATEIATQVGLVSHDSLRRMLVSLGVTISLGLTLSVRLIVALGGAQGWIAIDDVLLPKPFAKALALRFLGLRSRRAAQLFRPALGLRGLVERNAGHSAVVRCLAERPDAQAARQKKAAAPSAATAR